MVLNNQAHYGALVAQGTSNSPITFTYNLSGPEPETWQEVGSWWDELYFTNGTDDATSVLDHCIIKFSQRGTHCENASPTIQNSTIQLIRYNGLHLDSSSSPLVENCTISGDVGGLDVGRWGTVIRI